MNAKSWPPGAPANVTRRGDPGQLLVRYADDGALGNSVSFNCVPAGFDWATSGGPGFTGLAYRSSDHRLSFAAGGKGLFVQSATAQCDNGAAGLDVKQFDRIDLGGFGDSIADSSAIISPAQRISSP